MKKSEPTIIVEETFDSSIEKVWNSITQIDQMREWFFDNIPDFKPEVGFETEFIVKSDERVFTHQWQITEVIPLKLIKYNWKYEEYDGNAFVVFELTEQAGLTKLSLKNIVSEDFSDDIPEFRRESCIGGWEYFINQRLKNYLEKN